MPQRWIKLTSEYDGTVYYFNIYNILAIQQQDGSSYTTIYFANVSFDVKESAEDIMKLMGETP
jgi:hypothetical protein